MHGDLMHAQARLTCCSLRVVSRRMVPAMSWGQAVWTGGRVASSGRVIKEMRPSRLTFLSYIWRKCCGLPPFLLAKIICKQQPEMLWLGLQCLAVVHAMQQSLHCWMLECQLQHLHLRHETFSCDVPTRFAMTTIVAQLESGINGVDRIVSMPREQVLGQGKAGKQADLAPGCQEGGQLVLLVKQCDGEGAVIVQG